MFLDNNENKNKGSWLLIPISIALSLLFIFMSRLGWLDMVSTSLSYVFDPIYTTSSNVANNLKTFFGTLGNITEFRDEYNDMKVKLAEYEIQDLEYQKLKNENTDLKKQLELGNKENEYLSAEVLDHIETDYLIINAGSKDNIGIGDVVVIGDLFIGTIIDVNQYTSKVRLPISKSSFLESYILGDETSQKILSRAVANGSSDGIRIENISMNSEVENGDTVVVNDSKIGENLVLGTLVGLSEDPAKTTRTGYVSPAIDYYDLINVFVRIRNVD